jgi:glycosyltransferase involved in cell wall biosynthesis
MRVVWITHNYPRFAGDIAGAFLHPLAVALRNGGIDLRVVAPSDGGLGGQDILDGVPVRRVRYGTAAEERLAYHGNMMSAVSSPRGTFAFNRMRSALRAGAEDELEGADGATLVHAHWWIPSGLAAPVGVPMVLTCHGTDVRLLDRFPPASWLARSTFRRARVVTTVSTALAEIVQLRVGITVPPDAIQPMPVANIERPWTDRTGNVVVLGRLTAQKRIHLAVEAIAVARKLGRRVRLTIFGDGASRAMLEARARDLGLREAVRFAGAVQPADVGEVFAHATCCLMPAQGEGFGLAAAEALMQGVPVVACADGGGLGEIVPPTGAGRLAAPTAEAISSAMLALLDDPAVPDAARMEGNRWRERLAPDAVASRCLTWYQRALHA